ncbi:MAG: hypothetical protein WD061_00355 [Candidatus Saccharimonadales bacterium]
MEFIDGYSFNNPNLLAPLADITNRDIGEPPSNSHEDEMYYQKLVQATADTIINLIEDGLDNYADLEQVLKEHAYVPYTVISHALLKLANQELIVWQSTSNISGSDMS